MQELLKQLPLEVIPSSYNQLNQLVLKMKLCGVVVVL